MISIEESEKESNEVGRAISLAESVAEKVAEKMARKKSERFTYLVAAVMSSFGITSMAVMAVYYRFAWHMEVSKPLRSFWDFIFSASVLPSIYRLCAGGILFQLICLIS